MQRFWHAQGTPGNGRGRCPATPNAASGVDALTPSQLRVARMAAAGMSNRAIAQALFITIKTVEVHPGAAGPGPPASAYRKLSIPPGTALAEALTPIAPPVRAKQLTEGGVHVDV